MTSKSHTLPRIYTPSDLNKGGNVNLDAQSTHHLVHVMRRKEGDRLRVFNGRHGEYIARIEKTGKKQVDLECEDQIHAQYDPPRRRKLFFSPIRKQRQDFLIEKAVELGATDLHPVICAHTQIHKINVPRIEKQIIEALTQCERLDIPTLHAVMDFGDMINGWQSESGFFHALAVARKEGVRPQNIDPDQDIAFCIGPEGGFSQEELRVTSGFASLDLGPFVLRSETAALSALSGFIWPGLSGPEN